MASKDMDKLVSHAKTSGFVYQGSEIYDGFEKDNIIAFDEKSIIMFW